MELICIYCQSACGHAGLGCAAVLAGDVMIFIVKSNYVPPTSGVNSPSEHKHNLDNVQVFFATSGNSARETKLKEIDCSSLHFSPGYMQKVQVAETWSFRVGLDANPGWSQD